MMKFQRLGCTVHMHGGGLNATVGFRFSEPHSSAFSQPTELRIPQCVAVEIHLPAIRALDKAISIIVQPGDAAFGRRRMELDLALHPAVLILKSTSCRIEYVPDRDIRVFVGVIFRRVSIDYDVACAWHGDLQSHGEQPAVATSSASPSHCHLAADDPVLEFPEFLSLPLDSCTKRTARGQAAEGYLKRYCHRSFPTCCSMFPMTFSLLSVPERQCRIREA